MGRRKHHIEVREAFRDYTPPVSPRRAVDRLLGKLPEKYLAGLKTIVLTNAGGLNYDRRRWKTWSRKRKVAVVECRGLYHERWKNEPAWIEIFVDNALSFWPRWLLWIPLFRDLAFADALFHELGHHIHRVLAPEHKEREDVAEKWSKRLSRHYVRRRYWYLMPLLFVLSIITRALSRALKPTKQRAKDRPARRSGSQ